MLQPVPPVGTCPGSAGRSRVSFDGSAMHPPRWRIQRHREPVRRRQLQLSTFGEVWIVGGRGVLRRYSRTEHAFYDEPAFSNYPSGGPPPFLQHREQRVRSPAKKQDPPKLMSTTHWRFQCPSGSQGIEISTAWPAIPAAITPCADCRKKRGTASAQVEELEVVNALDVVREIVA
jgi:hypothetical protein